MIRCCEEAILCRFPRDSKREDQRVCKDVRLNSLATGSRPFCTDTQQSERNRDREFGMVADKLDLHLQKEANVTKCLDSSPRGLSCLQFRIEDVGDKKVSSHWISVFHMLCVMFRNPDRGRDGDEDLADGDLFCSFDSISPIENVAREKRQCRVHFMTIGRESDAG